MSEYEVGRAYSVLADDEPCTALLVADGWIVARKNGYAIYRGDTNNRVTNVRPLRVCANDEVALPVTEVRVLMQAADRAQTVTTDRVNAAYCAAGRALDAYDAARKPAIEEPLGDGARVLDKHGKEWRRWAHDADEGHHWVDRNGHRVTWQGAEAVHVLSPGVEVDRG